MNNNTLRVVIAGGGTGGHLFPAIAIGEALTQDGIKVKYIGSKYGIESKYKFINNDDISLLDIKGIQRSVNIKNILRNIVLPIKIIKSFYQSRAHRKIKNPVFLKCSFCSFRNINKTFFIRIIAEQSRDELVGIDIIRR